MSPSERELRSLVDLLDDEDSPSLALVHERILGLGEAVIPYLEEAHDRLGPRLRPRLDSLVTELRFRSLEEAVARLAAAPDPDLEEGAFLLGRIERPRLDPAPYRRWLGDVAAEVQRTSAAEPYLRLLRLNHVLFSEMGFKGNSARYYDPANSFLDRVIETRLGLPITLSTLVMLLGRRLGLALEGAGLPGHFMVRFAACGGAYFLDAFNRGRILTRAQCRQSLLSSGYVFREEYLKPVKSRDILARMMRNLLSVYQRGGQTERARQVSALVELLLTRGGRQIE